jgi:YidC/Oxa1 family membrane protein insertase
MDRKQIIGILLIFILFYVWTVINAPSEQELKEIQARRDSIELAQNNQLNDQTAQDLQDAVKETIPQSTVPAFESDSSKNLYFSQQFGPFGSAAVGTAEEVILENDQLKIIFNTKGGRIQSVLLKKYQKLIEDKNYKESTHPLYLLEDEKNIFDYKIPSHRVTSGQIRTSELYFTPSIRGNEIEFKAQGANGTAITQTYVLEKNGYGLNYQVGLIGKDQFVSPGARNIQLKWVNFLDKLEKNTQFEKMYSTAYYKELEDDPSYCNCRKSDVEDISDTRVKWVSHSNQFFNSSLIADGSFDGAILETVMVDEDSDDLKELRSEISIPLSDRNTETFNMSWYIGPNDFGNLRKMDIALEEIIPFGRSIFGSINRWAIRPLFDYLSKFISSKGLVILAMTLLVKILLFPFMYKMLQSQSKMSALKPELAKMKEKFKDDSQKQQMESMKVYREYGVNPLGGCLPVVLQMPVWFALYRFFPASIEFRQASFLWANDLSSYDVFFRFPFEVPQFMAYGNHLSLFTILWAGTTLIYTYYNTRHMDMASMNPAMKYMQYLMPVMFLFFFNNYAAGLTLYLFYSNVTNILQTVGAKKFLFSESKIRAQLETNKLKPKKKSGFGQRFEEAMKEQQRLAAKKNKSGK